MIWHNTLRSLLFVFCTIILFAAFGHLQSTEIDDVSFVSAPISVAISPSGDHIFIAEERAKRITKLNAVTGEIENHIPLSIEPSGIVIHPDGKRLLVAGGGEEGVLEMYDASTGEFLDSLPLGHTPVRPLIDQVGRVYVPLRFSNTVAVVDYENWEIVSNIPALREPVAAALSPDGNNLVIGNHLPSTNTIDEFMTDGGWMSLNGYSHGTDYSVSSVVLLVDTSQMRITSMVHLPNGSTSLRGICVSPDSRFAYVTHILARYQLPTTQLERGWMNTNAISIVDITKQTVVNTVLLDDIDNGAANPWDIACSPDGTKLIVTHAGTHEISIIDRIELHKRLEMATSGYRVTEITSDSSKVNRDFTFLSGIRKRIRLNLNGPRAMNISDNKIIIAGYYSDTIETYSYTTDSMDIMYCWNIALHDPFPETLEHAGERLFNDAVICFQSWQSCASCHPDGRADGLNWDLLNDGIGNPKNTKSLLYSHVTPPAMVTGIRQNAEIAVRAGLKYIQFSEHTESEAQAIDAYLISLEQVPSPYLDDPVILNAAKRGERVFIEAGCAACHPAPLYTDQKSYDVGTGSGREYSTLFDTPSLAELWRTAPYLYDGRAKNIDQVMREFNINDHHGISSSLEVHELDDLHCYLLLL